MHLRWPSSCLLIYSLFVITHTWTFALADSSTSVVLAKGNGLSLFNLSSSSTVDLLSDDSIPYSVDSLMRNDGNIQLFWSDMKHNTIRSGILVNESLLNSSDLLGSKDMGMVEDLAVDWVAGNVYWIVNPFGRIDVVRADGKHHSVVVSNLVHPRALAVDSEAGWMFWSDWNDQASIERSSLAGGDRRVIVHVGLKSKKKGWVNAIALDLAEEKVYWVDASSKSIHVASYDGQNERKLVDDDLYLSLPYSLALISGHLLWSDGSLRSIVQADVRNISDMAVVYETPQIVFDVKALQQHRAPLIGSGSHKCLIRNAGCSHLCLRDGPINFKCVCPFGMVLRNDKCTCTVPSGVLIVVTRVPDHQESIYPPVIYRQDATKPLEPLFPPLMLNKKSYVRSVAYDDAADLLVWLDAFDSKLYYHSGITGGSFRVSSEATSVAIKKSMEGQVYLAEGGGSPSISVCALATRVCVPLLIEKVWSPFNLFAVNSLLVWLDVKNGTMRVKTYSPESGRLSDLASGSNICCLTVDPITQEVLWMDKGKLIKYSFDSDSAITLPIPLPVENAQLVGALNGVLYVNDSLIGGGVKIHRLNDGDEWLALPVAQATEFVTVITTAALIPEVIVSPAKSADLSTDRIVPLSDFKQIEYEVTTVGRPKENGYNCGCVHGTCVRSRNPRGQAKCQCFRGYDGLKCEKRLFDVCTGYCFHGNCSIHAMGFAVCTCESGYEGRRCDFILSGDHNHFCGISDDSTLLRMNLRYRVTMFVSMSLILFLGLIVLTLTFLWLRTKRILARVRKNAAASGVGRNPSMSESCQTKQLRWTDFFTPRLNSSKGTYTDECSLLDQQKDPVLTNTHV